MARFADELPRRCIRLATRPGDLVFDPFAGQGTTLRVAHDLLASLRKARRVPARLVGVRLSGLAPAERLSQLPLETSDVETERDRGLTRAIDRVREKFGRKSILPGGITE